MKTFVTGALCTSILLLSGCQKDDNKNVADSQSSTEMNTKAVEQKPVKVALSSGIDQSEFDKSVRPQDDFFTYVNGGWLKSHTIPADKTSIGSFIDLRDQSIKDVKDIIEDVSKKQNLKMGSDEQKVGDLFRSYMDVKHRNELGIKPIQGFIDTINSLKNKDDLAAFFAKSEIDGGSSPLAFYVSVDAKNSARYATHIWQSGLGLPDKDYYFKKDERSQKIRDAYVAHIEKMFQLAGFANPKKSATMLMALETKLAKFHRDRRENRDSEKRYNKYQVSDLGKLAPHFNFKAYLEAQGAENQKDIIINQPEYIKGFDEVFAATSLADWKTFAEWKLIDATASYLTEALSNQNFDFYSKTLRGTQKQRPLWKRGVSVVNGNLGEVIGKIYVKRHFNSKAKARMSQLVENLREAYGASIKDLSWMSDETKKAAAKKLAAFTPKIGYPDRWRDYSGIKINKNDLIGNLLSADLDGHKKQIQKLSDPIHKWEWGMTPQTVNAYYNPTQNEIVFPAAILQPPFFNMSADDAVNYGGIGAVIGHEMGHGFDDQGSRYDGKGNLNNWWTKNDLKEFKKRTAKLVAQYSGYKVFDDLNVDGKLTLGENIGDLSGITIAYRAYKKSLNGKKAPVIDGLTGDQRFFMGFAQIWRGKAREKALRMQVATNPHSPSKFRALGTLSNMPEFYSTFNVKEGDKMYIKPEDRVKIW